MLMMGCSHESGVIELTNVWMYFINIYLFRLVHV